MEWIAVRQLQQPRDTPATWDALVDWASRLRVARVRADEPGTRSLAGSVFPRCGGAELAASAAVDKAIESLRGASAVEPTATIRVSGTRSPRHSTTRDEAAERKKPNVSFVPLERLR